MKKYLVKVTAQITNASASMDVVIYADSEEEAKQLAEEEAKESDQVWGNVYFENSDIDESSVEADTCEELEED